MRNKSLRKEHRIRNKHIRRGWRGWCQNLQHLDIEDIDLKLDQTLFLDKPLQIQM